MFYFFVNIFCCMSKIIVFKTSWCDACKSEVPRIQEAAHKLGYSVDVIDIERCPVNMKPRCDSVDFVPHVELDGEVISVDKLVSMADQQ